MSFKGLLVRFVISTYDWSISFGSSFIMNMQNISVSKVSALIGIKVIYVMSLWFVMCKLLIFKLLVCSVNFSQTTTKCNELSA